MPVRNGFYVYGSMHLCWISKELVPHTHEHKHKSTGRRSYGQVLNGLAHEYSVVLRNVDEVSPRHTIMPMCKRLGELLALACT